MSIISHVRQRATPTQEFLSLLPSWHLVRRLRSAYARRILQRCGSELELSRNVLFEFPERISIGSRVFINSGTIITARAPIVIGDDVLIGPYVIINSGNHGYANLTIPIRLQAHVSAPIVIGDDVWIGANAVLLRGVQVGQGSIIAAGSVVTKDVPEHVVVAGVPANVIRTRGAAHE
jgi:acetyltransferase-like isoleucine patch superfamily enzyme